MCPISIPDSCLKNLPLAIGSFGHDTVRFIRQLWTMIKVTKKNELNVYMIVIFLHQGIGLQDEVSLKKLHWPSVKPQVTFRQVHCSYLVTKNDHFPEETIAQWQFIQEPKFQVSYVE